MPETIDAGAFGVLATAVVGGAVMVIASRNVVHAAFWLLESLVATAGLYLLLSAEFLALVQLMVYAGAVSVLTLFTIMLTLRRREDAVRPLDHSVWGGSLAIGFSAVVFLALSRFSPAIATPPGVAPGVAAFGRELFSTWTLPFEIASLVLLVALVGAVWWSSGGGER